MVELAELIVNKEWPWPLLDARAAVDIGSDLDGTGKTLRDTSPQARHHFTQADQVNQLVGASEADPDPGFMARMKANNQHARL